MNVDEPGQARRVAVGEFQSLGPQVLAPASLAEGCQLGWQPNALGPVFYGTQDFDAQAGSPVPVRVFYPSLDGIVDGARIVQDCGRFPLVVFLHGHCRDDLVAHHLAWRALGRRLAKSGYVVLFPQVPGIGSGPGQEDHAALRAVTDLLDWARTTWADRSVLLASPATAVLGHSYGGLLAGRFASSSDQVAVFASLSSGWEHENPALAELLPSLDLPKLFVDGQLDITALSEPLWQRLRMPKHRIVFAEANHWDYLPDGPQGCHGQSKCRFFPGAAFESVVMFLSKYLPPEFATDLPDRIDDDLVPPPLNLTPAQQFYAGGNWLTESGRLLEDNDCGVRRDWTTPSTRTVPDVRFLPLAAADAVVRANDLRPRAQGAGGRGSWVFSQSPVAGRRVNVDDVVVLHLRVGPVP